MTLHKYFVVCAFGILSLRGDAVGQVMLLTSTLEERQVTGGTEYVGLIRLRNDGAAAQEVKLYQTDYAFFADGRTEYGAAGSHTRSNAKWITINPARVIVPPHGEAVAKYTVSVPQQQLAGSYWSMIMVEAIASGTAESTRSGPESRSEFGVQTNVRYGIQVATHTGGSGSYDARVENGRISMTEQGRRQVEFDVMNTGTHAYRPRLTAQLINGEGREVAAFRAERGLLYPGTSLRQRFELPAGLTGEYRVVVVTDTGGADLFGAQFRVKF